MDQEAAKRRRPHMSTNNATMVARMVTWSTAKAGKEVACAEIDRERVRGEEKETHKETATATARTTLA